MDHVAGCFYEGINCGNKREALPQQLRAALKEHVQEQHEEVVAVYTDGSKMENRVGRAAVRGQQVVLRKLNGQSSIFTAELQAMLDALSLIRQERHNNFVVYCDSKSVLQAVQRVDSTHVIVAQIVKKVVWLGDPNKKIMLY